MASKTATDANSGPDVEEALDAVDQTLDRLKTLYEQYFLGIQKQAPAFLHTDVERKLRDLTQVNIRNTGLRYRLATLQQKFGSYNSYWRRTLRQIENGTYLRNLAKIGREAAKTGSNIPEEILAAMPKRMREQVIRDRDAAIAAARRRKQAEEGGGEDGMLEADENAPPPPPEADEVAAMINEPSVLRRELKTRSGAHIVSADDGDMDFDKFFSAFEDDAPKPEHKPAASVPSPAIQKPIVPQPRPTSAIPRPAGTQPSGPASAQPSAPAAALPRPIPGQPTGAVPIPRPTPSIPAAGRQTGPIPVMSRQTGPIPTIPDPSQPASLSQAGRQTGPIPTMPSPSQRQTGPIPTMPSPSQRQTGPIPTMPSPSQAGRQTGPIPAMPSPSQRQSGAIPTMPTPSQAGQTGSTPPTPSQAARQSGAIPTIPSPSQAAKTGAHTIPRVPVPASQASRPNPIAPGSSTKTAPVDVESMSGPFPRVTTQPGVGTPPSPRPTPPRPPPNQAKPPAAPLRPPPGMTDADVNALHAKYVKAKEMVGEKVDPSSREKLLKTITQTAPKIMEQYKASGVDFSVVVKDNQVVIKAKPKT